MADPISIGQSTIKPPTQEMGGGLGGLGKISDQDISKFQSAMADPTSIGGASDMQSTSIGSQTMGDVQGMQTSGTDLTGATETTSSLFNAGPDNVFSTAAQQMPTGVEKPGLGRAGMEVLQHQVESMRGSEKELVKLLNSPDNSPKQMVWIQYLTSQISTMMQIMSQGVSKVVQTVRTLLEQRG